MSKKKNGYIKSMSRAISKAKNVIINTSKPVLFIAVFAIIGVISLLATRAGAPSANRELEDTTLSSCAEPVIDPTASGGEAIQLGDTSNCSQTASTGPGAHLPISYNLSSLTGTLRYVATNGSDASSTGSISAPYATLAKAISVSAAGNTIVVRGGEYRDQSRITVINKSGLKIIAYPNETPIFNGAQAVSSSSGWTTEGSLRYRNYQPQAISDFPGVAFTDPNNMRNLSGDGSGRYPDQVWIGNNALDQVKDKSQVTRDGLFYVDQANNRLYMMATDVAKGNIEASKYDQAIRLNSPNAVVEGLSFTRYSPSAYDFGVILVDKLSQSAILRNIEVSQTSYDGIIINEIDNAKFEHITVSYAGWRGFSTFQTDNAVFDAIKVTNGDPFDEFTGSPVSGALKTSKNRGTVVKNSQISNNKSHGLWFDQSNINTTVANNIITDNSDTGVFYEISDGLLLINNYIKASGSGQPFKAAGSSGLKLVNNTLVGGQDPIGIYTDARSGLCSTATNLTELAALCAGTGSQLGERQGRFGRPVTMDWQPRLDLMLNNIVAYPDSSKYCDARVPLCITTQNGNGSAPIQTIIHQADKPYSGVGIPKTQMSGNVYANGSSIIIKVKTTSSNYADYTTLAEFAAAMANPSIVNIPGLESNGKFGNSWVNADGSPTSALAAIHSSATAIPSDANINKYITAGTRHFGVIPSN